MLLSIKNYYTRSDNMKKLKSIIAVCLACAIPNLSVSAFDLARRATETPDLTAADIIATAAPVMQTETDETVPELPVELKEQDVTKAERFIVKYKNANHADHSRLSSAYTVKSIETMEIEHTAEAKLFNNGEKSQIQLIELDKAVDIEIFAAELSRDADIDYVQPDYRLDLSAGDLGNAEHIETAEDIHDETIAPVEDDSEVLEKSEEQETFTENDFEDENSAVVAIIDTGIDTENTNFNLFTNINDNGNDEDENGYSGDIHGWDFVNNYSSVYNPLLGLEQAHGTHIAGVISRTAPDAQILPLKVFENGIAYTSDIIEAIQYADTMGANIVNCSWGCTDENLALKEAMESTDMLFVCSVGNNRLDLSETPIYPACYDLDNIISVTSVNADGGLSYFSNYGGIDIAALGREVEGIFPGGETGTLTGTSISAGFVSGALASVYTDAEETVERLYNTADKLLNLQDYVTAGRRLNLNALLSNTVNNEIIDINPEEDFNTEGYSRTPAESWELFSALENVSVKAGKEFFAVLKADGTVWMWGRNNYGQLGNGTYINSTAPQQVPSLTNITQIDAGSLHMLALSEDGTVYAWGYNGNGGLGNGTKTNSNVPVQMLNTDDVKSVHAGEKVSFVINNDGGLYICGQNYSGEQCDNTGVDKTTLHQVPIIEAVKYATGEWGSCMAVTEDGKLYTWGSNSNGKLGNDTTANNHIPQLVITSGIVEADMGYFSAMAIDEDEHVYFWGIGGLKHPVMLNNITGADKVCEGRQSEFALCGNTIKCKGSNTNGILGVGSTSYKSNWTNVSGSFTDFSINEYRAIALAEDGCIYTWGIVNADTGEYSTSPMKISGRINDFAGDSFDDAATLSHGLTHGEFTPYYRADYYRFTPSVTDTYYIYSISSMDLVCKIYTKNSAGNYVMQFSNDDAHGIMSSNNRDFYISQALNSDTEYYVYVYPYSSSYSGAYELYVECEPGDTTYTFASNQNETHDMYINVGGISSFEGKAVKVTYDSSRLELNDACVFTKAADTTAKVVAGTNITILSVSDGEFVFGINQTIPFGRKLSGTVNIIRFKSFVNGNKTVRFEITDI